MTKTYIEINEVKEYDFAYKMNEEGITLSEVISEDSTISEVYIDSDDFVLGDYLQDVNYSDVYITGQCVSARPFEYVVLTNEILGGDSTDLAYDTQKPDEFVTWIEVNGYLWGSVDEYAYYSYFDQWGNLYKVTWEMLEKIKLHTFYIVPEDNEDVCYHYDAVDGLYYSRIDECYYQDKYNMPKINSDILEYHDLQYTNDDILRIDENDNSVTIGLELELNSNDWDVTDNFVSWVHANFKTNDVKDSEITLAEDGSLESEGVECITAPMTLNYFKQVYAPKLKALMQKAKYEGMFTDECTGLHINVGMDFVNLQKVKEESEYANYMHHNGMDDTLKSFLNREKLYYCMPYVVTDDEIRTKKSYRGLFHLKREVLEFRGFGATLDFEQLEQNIYTTLNLLGVSY